MGRIALCADTESLIRPMLLGLERFSLEGEEWLVSIPDAAEARAFMAKERESGTRGVDEVWIVSSDQLEAVNLAAALRKDDPELPIYLVACEQSGSLLSRVSGLRINGVWSVEDFCSRFDTEAKRRSLMDEVAALSIEEVVAPKNNNPREHIAACEKSEPIEVLEDEAKAPAPSRKASVPMRNKECFMLAALSGSGGVGKSSFVSLAACMTQARGFRTAIIDMDPQFGDIAHMVSGAPCIPMDELLDEPSRLDDPALERAGKLPTIIGAPAKMESSERLAGRIADIVSICSKRFDAIYVDTSANWTDDHAWVLENSDCALMFLDQRASSVRSMQRAVDLCMRMGIATGSFVYVLNHCSKNAIFSGMDIANVVQGAQVAELRDGESEVEEYLGSGLAQELSSLRNELTASVDALISDLLPSSAFFAGPPEWSLPADGRGAARGKEERRSFFPERRERKRRKERKAARGASFEPQDLLDEKGSTVTLEGLR